MTEKKTKATTVTTGKGASAVASKLMATKEGVAAKKPVVKKQAAKSAVAVLAKPKKTKSPAEQKVAIPATKKKSTALKDADAKDKPIATQKRMTKPTPEILYGLVETAAYLIAEQHGFKGHSHDHWAAAEREIAAKLDL